FANDLDHVLDNARERGVRRNNGRRNWRRSLDRIRQKHIAVVHRTLSHRRLLHHRLTGVARIVSAAGTAPAFRDDHRRIALRQITSNASTTRRRERKLLPCPPMTRNAKASSLI